MVTIRNASMAHNRVVQAGEALTIGMVVKMVQGAAKGEPTKVMRATSAEVEDPSIVTGVVTYVQDNDLSTPFLWNRTDDTFTVNAGEDGILNVPVNEFCLFWYGLPVVGLHEAVVHASLDFDTVREGDKVTVIGGKFALLTDPATQKYVGTIYQHEGPEVTILANAL